MNSHLSALLLCLGDKFAADRSSKKTFLDTHQLCYPLHRRRELFPQTEELIPIYGGPLCIQGGDLRRIWTEYFKILPNCFEGLDFGVIGEGSGIIESE